MKILDRIRGRTDHAEASPPAATEPSAATVRSARMCAACGRPALTTDEFVAAAKEAGFVVDPVTGDEVSSPVSGVFGGTGDLIEMQTQRQQRFDQVEARRGYACRACGKPHCTACLMSTAQHPVTGGPRCPSCGEGPHEVLDD